jgi:hypothetical protein
MLISLPISYIDLSIIFYGQTCRQTVVNLWTLFEKFIDKIIQVYRQFFFVMDKLLCVTLKVPLSTNFLMDRLIFAYRC